MATTLKYGENLCLFRSIHRELRRFTKSPKVAKDPKDASVEMMLNLLRSNQVTEKRFCRPQDHYKYFAQTYLTYLRSSRMQSELVSKYFNKGERDIESSARLVGLELPRSNS